jgi:hypothetical protein
MITWTITSMESQPTTGIVVSANWLCSSEQDGFTASMLGNCVFSIPEGEYIPYDQLTQDEVLNWVWTNGGIDKTATEDAVNSALQLQIAPPVVQQPLPWSN